MDLTNVIDFLLNISTFSGFAIFAGTIESELIKLWPWFNRQEDVGTKRLIVGIISFSLSFLAAAIALRLMEFQTPGSVDGTVTYDILIGAIQGGIAWLTGAAAWYEWTKK